MVSERSDTLLGYHWHTTLAPPGSGNRALADVSVRVRTVGPLATRRTVSVVTSDQCVRLELGWGLELGVGMPKWLRSGRAYSDDEAIGGLAIGRGVVTLLDPSGQGTQGAWRFEGQLLGYHGFPEPVVYGEVCLRGQRLGELLVPRLHTYDKALSRSTVPLWRGVRDGIDEPARRWMLALTTLALFCVAAGQDHHAHQPGVRSD